MTHPYAGKPNAGDCWNCLGTRNVLDLKTDLSVSCVICDGTGKDPDWEDNDR